MKAAMLKDNSQKIKIKKKAWRIPTSSASRSTGQVITTVLLYKVRVMLIAGYTVIRIG